MMEELSKHITTSRGRRQLRIRKWRHKCYSRSTSSSTSSSYSSEPGQHKRKQANYLLLLSPKPTDCRDIRNTHDKEQRTSPNN